MTVQETVSADIGAAVSAAPATRTVGGVLADALAAYGTEHFFLLTGGDNAFFLELRDRGVQSVLARSERSAAFMADAYARLTRRASFVYGQFGPGAAVALSGLIDAQFARSPVVGLMSDTKTDVRHRFAYQELDQVAMFAPFTKFAGRVERPDRVTDMLATAIRQSVSGCPGPSYLGVPSDMLLDPHPDTTVTSVADALRTVPPYRPRPEADSVLEAARLLETAERPVVLAGSGVVVSGAWAELEAFVTARGIPVVTTVGGKGSLSEQHPLCHGVAGRYSRRSANVVLREADVVLAIGTRFSDMTTDRGKAVVRDRHTVIHCDIEPTAIGANVPPAVSLVGDAAAALVDLDAAVATDLGTAEWSERCRTVTAAWLADRAAIEARTTGGPISPVDVVAGLRGALDPTDVLVTDTGYMSAWTSALYDVRTSGPTHLRTAGSLGWSLPAAIGAQLAVPDKRVVSVIGDGGIGYHISDLETAVRLGTPVVFVCMNNSCLAFEYQVQSRLIHDVEPTLVDFNETDYDAVARDFGASARRVEDRTELAGTVRWALEQGGPVLLDVVTDRDAPAPVTNYDHLGERPL